MKTLKEKIGNIVQEAIEDQIDWEAYYEGAWEEPTEKILDLVNEYVYKTVDTKNYYKFLKKLATTEGV